MISSVPFNYNASGRSALDMRESMADFVRVMRSKRGRKRFSSEPDSRALNPTTRADDRRHQASRWLYQPSYPQLWAVATAQAIAAGDLVCKTSTAVENLLRASDVTYATAVATPNAPTLTDGAINAGTSISAGANHVKVSYQFPWGEGPLSAAGAVTSTAHAIIIGALAIALPAPAMYANIYVETSQGSGVYAFYGTTVSQNFTVTAYGNGNAPPATTYAGTALAVTQYNFAQLFVGQSGSFKDANVALVAGYSIANLIRVYTSGTVYADLDASYTYLAGDLFAPAANGGGTALQNQTLAPVLGSGPTNYATNSGLARLSTHRAVQGGTTLNYAILQLDTVLALRQR